MKKHKNLKSTFKRNHGNGDTSHPYMDRKLLEQVPCACGYDSMLPWWCPYVVTMVTMLVRVSYVVSPRSWWMLHPDEVYQSIEVAFSEMTGYGFRSYEYLPAPTNNSVSMETQALKSGMYALRPFVLPHIYTMVAVICRLAGVSASTFLICRVFNAMVTSTLPLAVYNLVHTIFRCRLVAVLSCTLTAVSLQLAVFGTHPVVNSFIAPLTVFGLSVCLAVNSYESQNLSHQGTTTTGKENGEISDINANFYKKYEKSQVDCHVTRTIARGHVIQGDNLTRSLKSTGKMKSLEQNQTRPDVQSSSDMHRFVDYSYKTSNIESKYSQDGYKAIFTELFHWKPYLGGLITGVTCYIRPDTSLFISLTFVPLIVVMETKWTTKVAIITTIISGVVSSVFILVIDDFRHYGNFVLSPVQWFTFNVVSQKASAIFSVGNSNSYADILLLDKTNLVLNALGLIILLLSPFMAALKNIYKKHFCALLLSHVFLLLIYSIIGHKEPRIIHNSFILHVIVSAATIHFLVVIFKSTGVKRCFLTASLFTFIVVCTMHSYQNFPSVENKTANDWSYKDPEQSRDINLCLNFIRNQDDVTGVMINASVYNLGGFSVLEHDVPLLVLVHYEYHYYEVKRHNRLGTNNRIRVFTDFSDFIDIDNQMYVYDVIRNKNLNYIVTQGNNQERIMELGFENMYSYGKQSVFKKRDQEPRRIKTLQSETEETAAILEYEANWLVTNSLYSKAIWRIKLALDVNRKLGKRSRVRLYQLLMVCYGKLKQWDKVKIYQNECFSIYGRDSCVKQQDKLVRHDEYHRLEKIPDR